MPKRAEGPISKAEAARALGTRRKEHQEYLDERVPNIPALWPNDPAAQASSYRGAKAFAERKTNKDRFDIGQKLYNQAEYDRAHPSPPVNGVADYQATAAAQAMARYATTLAEANADPEFRKAQILSTRRNVDAAENLSRLAGNDYYALGKMQQQAFNGGYVPATRTTASAARAGRPGQDAGKQFGAAQNEAAVQQAYLRLLLARLSGGSSGGVARM